MTNNTKAYFTLGFIIFMIPVAMAIKSHDTRSVRQESTEISELKADIKEALKDIRRLKTLNEALTIRHNIVWGIVLENMGYTNDELVGAYLKPTCIDGCHK